MAVRKLKPIEERDPYAALALELFDKLQTETPSETITEAYQRLEIEQKRLSPETEHLRLLGIIADKIEDGTLFYAGFYRNKDLAEIVRKATGSVLEIQNLTKIRHEDEWHEDHGPVLWWRIPAEEPPYVGTPLDIDFPEGVMHWTPLPTPNLR